MRRGVNAEVVLGACVVLAGLLLMFVWIPLDTETGIIEKVRSRREVGDAMAPTVAAGLLCFSGLLLCRGAGPGQRHRALEQLVDLPDVAVG